jgi:hypothetical protein
MNQNQQLHPTQVPVPVAQMTGSLPGVTDMQYQQPMMVPFCPQPVFLLPAPPLPLSAPPSPLLFPLAPTAVPPMTPLLFNGTGFEPIPAELQNFDVNGNQIPAEGYSFVHMSVSPSVGASVSPRLTPENSEGEGVSRSASPLPELMDAKTLLEAAETCRTSSAVSSEGANHHQKKAPKRYPHRSKQERIEQVHASLKELYTAQDLYARDDEVLRGADVVRVHVKTFQGLNKIQNALDEVQKDPNVCVEKIATPFSMKNKYQKKGFIVYLKLSHATQVPFVKRVFERYPEHFKKCDVALPKSSKYQQEQKNELPALKTMEDSVDWADIPPTFLKQSSVEAA